MHLVESCAIESVPNDDRHKISDIYRRVWDQKDGKARVILSTYGQSIHAVDGDKVLLSIYATEECHYFPDRNDQKAYKVTFDFIGSGYTTEEEAINISFDHLRAITSDEVAARFFTAQ